MHGFSSTGQIDILQTGEFYQDFENMQDEGRGNRYQYSSDTRLHKYTSSSNNCHVNGCSIQTIGDIRPRPNTRIKHPF